MRDRAKILGHGILSLFWSKTGLPKSSLVLSTMLSKSGLPYWTAWYVPRHQVVNDLWGQSHFNHAVDGENYHVLRTGAFPFIKFHCSKRPVQDLRIEDKFYGLLKILNFGLPTLAYGLSGLLMAAHTEQIKVAGQDIKLYFWYKEDRGSPN